MHAIGQLYPHGTFASVFVCVGEFCAILSRDVCVQFRGAFSHRQPCFRNVVF